MKDAAFQCRNHVWVKGFTILGNPDDDYADTDVDDVYDEHDSDDDDDDADVVRVCWVCCAN